MSTTVQTLTIIGGLAAIVSIIVGAQTVWIVRALDRIDKRLDRIEDTLLVDHAQRITRLEERTA